MILKGGGVGRGQTQEQVLGVSGVGGRGCVFCVWGLWFGDWVCLV